jgi:hypothetical protein
MLLRDALWPWITAYKYTIWRCGPAILMTLLLDPAQVEELRDVVSAPPPDGGLWTGRKVARWITGRIGRKVSPQRGVESLRRLDLTRQVPRPANPKASLYEQARFKKISTPASPSFKAPKRRFRSKSGRSTNTASD